MKLTPMEREMLDSLLSRLKYECKNGRHCHPTCSYYQSNRSSGGYNCAVSLVIDGNYRDLRKEIDV